MNRREAKRLACQRLAALADFDRCDGLDWVSIELSDADEERVRDAMQQLRDEMHRRGWGAEAQAVNDEVRRLCDENAARIVNLQRQVMRRVGKEARDASA